MKAGPEGLLIFAANSLILLFFVVFFYISISNQYSGPFHEIIAFQSPKIIDFLILKDSGPRENVFCFFETQVFGRHNDI